MYAFDYVRPKSLAEAATMLGEDGDAKLIAGGHTLIPTLKARLAAPSRLVDLGAIEELRSISVKDGMVRIGAMARHGEVAESAEIAAVFPSLAALAHLIGDPAVRHRGTIGGSVANNDPAADYPAALPGARCHDPDQRAQALGRRVLSRACSTTALKDGETDHLDQSFPKCRQARRLP